MKQLLLFVVFLFALRGLLEVVQRQYSPKLDEIESLNSRISSLLKEVETLRLIQTNRKTAQANIDQTPQTSSQNQLHKNLASFPDVPLSDISAIVVPNVPPSLSTNTTTQFKKKYAYVSMITNCSANRKYRKYLSGILVFTNRLRSYGSTEDVIILVSFAADLKEFSKEDLALIDKAGLKLEYVEAFWEKNKQTTFGDINAPKYKNALDKSGMYNKIFVWSLYEYDLVQYIDADIMAIENMDQYFEKDITIFTRGWMSLLQGGWYMMKPDRGVFDDLKAMVAFRYSHAWTPEINFHVPGIVPSKGDACLDDDQGLFWCYFRYSQRSPPFLYIDHRNTAISTIQWYHKTEVLQRLPKTDFQFRFEHFGGRFKPWVVCRDKKMLKILPSIAAQHAKHWPPTKLKSFRVYCDTFMQIRMDDYLVGL